jgi:hypothetical protein
VNKDRKNKEWMKAKASCRLSADEVRMARELGIGPRALIKNIPNPKQRWKAPVGVWIRNLYAKSISKTAGTPREAPPRMIDPHESPSATKFEESRYDLGLRAHQEIPEDELMLRRYLEFELAAEYVAAAFEQFEAVQKVALFGSVALLLAKEVSRFRKFPRAGQSIFHECRDVDLAVWLTDLTNLESLQRARSRALNNLFDEHGVGVAHHQVDVFLMAAGTNAYLGRLCNFGECPKGRRECLVQDCGAVKFLRQFEGFALRLDALSPRRAITLFERGVTSFSKSPQADPWEIPF